MVCRIVNFHISPLKLNEIEPPSLCPKSGHAPTSEFLSKHVGASVNDDEEVAGHHSHNRAFLEMVTALECKKIWLLDILQIFG